MEFSARLIGSIRPRDIAGRIGGNEFAVLLSDVSGVEALATAERIVLASIAPFVIGGRAVHVPASVGVALGSDVRDEPVLTALVGPRAPSGRRRSRGPRGRGGRLPRRA